MITSRSIELQSHAFDRARQLIPVNNLMSCQFLTRACPRRCSYCGIVNSPLRDKILRDNQWSLVYQILDQMGVSFNLVLGNEVLYLKDALVDLVVQWKGGTPYALYTTAPDELWEEWRDPLVKAGLQNLSMGCDYPRSVWSWDDLILQYRPDYEQIKKSKRAYEALRWAKDQGVPDTQATCTVTSKNVGIMHEIALELSEHNIWTAYNLIHYDKDGRGMIDGFDFFPPHDMIADLLLDTVEPEDLEDAYRRVFYVRNEKRALIFNNDESLQGQQEFWDTTWHCTRPNLITVDPDGRLRTCGYRRGKQCNQMSVLEFAEDPERATLKWLRAWKADMLECPGCTWDMWYSAESNDVRGADSSQQYFGQHGMADVDDTHWADVNIGNKGSVGAVNFMGNGNDFVRRRGEWEAVYKPLVEAWTPGEPMPYDGLGEGTKRRI